MLGPLLVGISGSTLDSAERELLRSPAVGGVVLFTRNYNNPAQLTELTGEIHALREPPLVIAVDHEGGNVQRFRPGFTELPHPRWLGRVYDVDPGTGLDLAQTFAWLLAAELRACGVDLSFAPVLDIDAGISRVIGNRGLHSDPSAIARLGHAWVRGMRRAGMAAVGKHFPGHGSVEADSHVAIPCDTRSLAEIARADLIPFQRLAGSGLPGMMAAHVVYPDVDDRPAGFSPRWIGDILRRRLRYQGAVLSDDLGMVGAATAGSLKDRVAAALAADCDAALICDPDQAQEAVAGSSLTMHPTAALRLARLHGGPAPGREQLHASDAYQVALDQITTGIPGLPPPEPRS